MGWLLLDEEALLKSKQGEFEGARRSLKELAAELRSEKRASWLKGVNRFLSELNEGRSQPYPMLLDAIDKVVTDIDPIAENWEARRLACAELAQLCRNLESSIYVEMKLRVQPLKDLLN